MIYAGRKDVGAMCNQVIPININGINPIKGFWVSFLNSFSECVLMWFKGEMSSLVRRAAFFSWSELALTGRRPNVFGQITTNKYLYIVLLLKLCFNAALWTVRGISINITWQRKKLFWANLCLLQGVQPCVSLELRSRSHTNRVTLFSQWWGDSVGLGKRYRISS